MATGSVSEIQQMFADIQNMSKAMYGNSDVTKLDDKDQLKVLEKLGMISHSEATHTADVWAKQNAWRKRQGF